MTAVEWYDAPPPPGPWQSRAKCRNSKADFFPDTRVSDGSGAKAICRSGCPVLAECFYYAMGQTSLHGVWGGTTEADRKKRRRERRWAL